MSLEKLKSNPNLTVQEIDMLINAETDSKMIRKLFYFRLRALNLSIKEASKKAGIKQFSAYKLEDKWNEGGYNSLLHKKGSGRKSKLNSEQMDELEKYFKMQNNWTMKEIQNLIKDKWGISYTHSALERFIKAHFNVKIIKQSERKKNNSLIKIDNENMISEIDLYNDEELLKLINRLHNEKNDVVVVKKLFYLILEKIGLPNEINCDILSISSYTGKNWKKQWKDSGFKNLARKKGSGPKSKLSNDDLKKLYTKMGSKEVWFTPEIINLIEKTFGIRYSRSHIYRILEKIDVHHRKPRPHDYRQKKNYRTTFNLNMRNKFNKYHLKYDIETGCIMDLKSKKKVKIYSFDEAGFDFIGNMIKLWSVYDELNIEVDTDRYGCKAAGFFSLTPDGTDYVTFQENAKKETIGEILKEMRKIDPDGIMIVLIDNFKSHKNSYIKNLAKELDIDLFFLPPYSPQLQPIEKVWLDIKHQIFKFKIDFPEFKKMKKDERRALLMELVELYYYESVKSKNKWNMVFNDFILPNIKKLHPRTNSDIVLEKK